MPNGASVARPAPQRGCDRSAVFCANSWTMCEQVLIVRLIRECPGSATRAGTPYWSSIVAAVCRASCRRASRTPADVSSAFQAGPSRRASTGRPLPGQGGTADHHAPRPAPRRRARAPGVSARAAPRGGQRLGAGASASPGAAPASPTRTSVTRTGVICTVRVDTRGQDPSGTAPPDGVRGPQVANRPAPVCGP